VLEAEVITCDEANAIAGEAPEGHHQRNAPLLALLTPRCVSANTRFSCTPESYHYFETQSDLTRLGILLPPNPAIKPRLIEADTVAYLSTLQSKAIG
jgi:hypothetical protein